MSYHDFRPPGNFDYGYPPPSRNRQGYNSGSSGGHRNPPSPPPVRDTFVGTNSDKHGHESAIQASVHQDRHAMSSMKSYLHFDLGDTVLVKEWVLRNHWDTLLTCLAFLLLALLVEGLKCYREHLYKRLSFAVQRQVPIGGGGGGGGGGHLRPGQSAPGPLPHHHSQDKEQQGSASTLLNSSLNLRMFSWPHFVQSLLHVVQVVLSYGLMLGIMTLNAWLCLSIVAGAGFGYFLFSWRKVTIVHVAEHCH